MLIYFIHRACHHRILYKRFHKVHHQWIIPTPFASHAMHWFDALLQSLPYHIYVFLFPMHKLLYLAFFTFVNIWTVGIHDGHFAIPEFMESFINGSSHHSDHHRYNNYNYGQFFTLWDRLLKSYRLPSGYVNQQNQDD